MFKRLKLKSQSPSSTGSRRLGGRARWSENKQPCLQSVVRLEDRPSGEDYFISGSFHFNVSKLTLLNHTDDSVINSE